MERREYPYLAVLGLPVLVVFTAFFLLPMGRLVAVAGTGKLPKQTSYARVLSGEIPILFDYDFNAYRAKYKDMANVEFVIPAEGTVVVPYVMSLVKDSPKPELGKKVLDFIMSDQGQAVWANAFLRPVRASAMSKVSKWASIPWT